jgi:hypothetical protein
MIPSPCAETSTPVYMFPVTITPLQGTLPFSLPLATPRVHGPCSVTCSARPCAARGHRLWCDRPPDAMALNISTDANYAGQLIPPSTPNIHLMGMTLVCGRLLNDFDTENTPVAAVIISRLSMIQKFPGGLAIHGFYFFQKSCHFIQLRNFTPAEPPREEPKHWLHQHADHKKCQPAPGMGHHVEP